MTEKSRSAFLKHPPIRAAVRAEAGSERGDRTGLTMSCLLNVNVGSVQRHQAVLAYFCDMAQLPRAPVARGEAE